MARRQSWANKCAPRYDRDRENEYGMALSRQRLQLRGFDPRVTGQSPDSIVKSWSEMIRRNGNASKDVPFTRATRAFLLLRNEPELGPLDNLSMLEKLITAPDVGPLILNCVFALGRRCALHLALSSKRVWVILAASVNYWDFYAGRLQNIGPTSVFLSTTPEFCIAEMMATRLTDPHGLKSDTPFTSWHGSAVAREDDIISTLYMVRDRIKPRANQARAYVPPFLRGILEDKVLKAIESIGSPKQIGRANQFTAKPGSHVFEPQMIFAATHLHLLLLQIYKQRQRIEVLQLHQTPFFDRRVLAVVLRACPHVTMLGLYNCPLIHFGDLIPILDLVYEINSERGESGMPPIDSFDFYPNFHTPLIREDGKSYPAFGITADSMDLDIVQRGLFGILLKGFLKAREMNLKILFDPGSALRAFLFKLPNPPLSVPTFFDGLYRYLDTDNCPHEQRQALYDLLKPVRLGLEKNMERDYPDWYMNEMGDYLPFCSSCGYEMLYELFSAGTRIAMPYRRVCAGCSLQYILDTEPQDMHNDKLRILANLFPDWKPKDFNKDAPIGSGRASGIMSLRSNKDIRKAHPVVQVNAIGQLIQTGTVIELVRDNKLQDDSLQGLPKLEDLVTDFERRWHTVFNECTHADLYARARFRLRAESAAMRGGSAPADRHGEVWVRERHAREVQSYDYLSAVKVHFALNSKGW